MWYFAVWVKQGSWGDVKPFTRPADIIRNKQTT